MVTTTDLSNFGYRELNLAARLLEAMVKQGLPDDFTDDEVHIMMNYNSGNVFLTNSECEAAMMNDGKLESFYCLGYYGNEGFLSDLLYQYKDGEIKPGDFEQLADICERNGKLKEAKEIRSKMREA